MSRTSEGVWTFVCIYKSSVCVCNIRAHDGRSLSRRGHREKRRCRAARGQRSHPETQDGVERNKLLFLSSKLEGLFPFPAQFGQCW